MTDAPGARDDRLPPPWFDRLRSVLAVAVFGFGVWTVIDWQMDDAVIRSIFLGITLIYTFAFYGPRKGRRGPLARALDFAAMALGAYVTLYIAVGFEDVFNRAGDVTTLDLVVAAAAVLLVLESTRRTAGWALPILSVVFLLYPLIYGQWMPGLLRSAPFGLERVLTDQYLSLDGILGPALRVMIDYIFLFIVFGSFLQRFGVTEFFVDFAKAVSGNRVGGGAKVAVVASCLMGMVSGSAVANVLSVGVITIPLMRRSGYSAEFASAVEAAASTGGQIMPPVMGAAAFLMAEFARIPYSQIIVHALIPALLYYATVWFAVHFEAIRLSLTTMSETVPDLRRTFSERGAAMLPIVLLTILIATDQPLSESVLISTVATVVVALLMPAFRSRVTPLNIIGAIREGIDNSMSLFTASACAGIVIGVVSLTGLGLKISTMIIDIANGHAVIALVLSAAACLIMGMGLPTQIIYLTLAILVVPGLIDMGINKAGAHLFIMYFGMMSMVTPPVCFAAFAAASLSGANMMRTGMNAFRLALAGQLVPFYFAYNPGLLLIGSLVDVTLDLLRTMVGLYAGGIAFEVFRLTPFQRDTSVARPVIWLRRALFGTASVALIFPSFIATAVGIGAVVLGVAVTLVSGTAPARVRSAR